MKYRKQLRIRLSEDQFYRLINKVNEEDSTTSNLVREAIDQRVKRVLKQTYDEKKK
jgi:hypothetical protein